jgi:hypothetical protein
MKIDLALVIAVLLCGIILFIMRRTRQREFRNERLHSFLISGLVVCLWTLLDTVMNLTHTESSVLLYNLKRILVTLLPYSFVWYFLSYTGSRLAQLRIVKRILIIIPVLDILVLISNPLHKLYFENYNGLPHPPAGPYLWIHGLLSYGVIFIGTLLLFRYVIKNVRKNPIVLLPGISILIPYALNILDSYSVISIPSNVIPLTFCVTFIVFIVASFRVKYFNLTNVMITDVFKTYKDGIILVGRDGFVLDYNNGIQENFPFLTIRLKKTRIGELLEELGKQVLEQKPENLFDEVRDQSKDFIAGTFILGPEDSEHAFELHRNRSSLKDPEAGYSLTFSDITAYVKRAMNRESDRRAAAERRAIDRGSRDRRAEDRRSMERRSRGQTP